jgi:hypothetical protein
MKRVNELHRYIKELDAHQASYKMPLSLIILRREKIVWRSDSYVQL